MRQREFVVGGSAQLERLARLVGVIEGWLFGGQFFLDKQCGQLRSQDWVDVFSFDGHREIITGAAHHCLTAHCDVIAQGNDWYGLELL